MFQKISIKADNGETYNFSSVSTEESQFKAISISELSIAAKALDAHLTGSNSERQKYFFTINEPLLGIVTVTWKFSGGGASCSCELEIEPDDYPDEEVLYITE